MTVGVAISTHRRAEVLSRALAAWALYMPDVVVVTHDVHGDGVAVTKNRGLAALMDAGCEHLFLADDDVWPVTPRWWRHYAADTEPHLMHCWGKSRLKSDDGEHTVWSWPRGVLLYAHRSVVDRVGGMRPEFGRWGGEHVEWSRRIHAAGFTAHPFQDVTVARTGVWYAEDYTRKVASTVSQRERAASEATRHELYSRFRGSSDFVPYRRLTSLRMVPPPA